MAPDPSSPTSLERTPKELGDILAAFRINGKGARVYFQAPGQESMTYPAILFRRSRMALEHADNALYRNTTGYMITVIDRDPVNPFRLHVAKLPTARFDRSYEANNLYHDVFDVDF